MSRRLLKHSETRAGWLFSLPWIIGFLALFVWPLVASIWWSLCRFDMISPPRWVGGDNYVRLANDVTQQQGFGQALTNTVYYSLLSVPLSVVIGVLLAVLLSAPVTGPGHLQNARVSTFGHTRGCRQHLVAVVVEPGKRDDQLPFVLDGNPSPELVKPGAVGVQPGNGRGVTKLYGR